MKKSLLLVILLSSALAMGAETVKRGNVQKVDFADTDVNGKIRSPDGSYLVQKKGMDFAPVYKVKKKLNDGVKESLEYIH